MSIQDKKFVDKSGLLLLWQHIKKAFVSNENLESVISATDETINEVEQSLRNMIIVNEDSTDDTKVTINTNGFEIEIPDMNDLAKKQDVITDLDDIRSGAAKGLDAVTNKELAEVKFTTDLDGNIIVSGNLLSNGTPIDMTGDLNRLQEQIDLLKSELVKSVNGILPDESGNVNVQTSGGGSTSVTIDGNKLIFAIGSNVTVDGHKLIL